MLEELRIRGLGVIADAVAPLGPGLTVVTGETGAGKTMLVTALLLLFGGRADAGRVRAGAEAASVEGRVLLRPGSAVARRVRDAGGELDPGDGAEELVLRRTVAAGGRSRASVGGAGAPVALLAELGTELLAVHGQADQLRLARPGAQRIALDRYAGIDTGPLAVAYATWTDAVRTLDARVGDVAQLRREQEVLEHALAQIDGAAPLPGELAELDVLSRRLAAATGLTEAATLAHDLIAGAVDPVDGVPDALGMLGTAGRALGGYDAEDPQLAQLSTRLTQATAEVADVAMELSSYVAGIDADPLRLDTVEQRRAVLGDLVRRYGDPGNAGAFGGAGGAGGAGGSAGGGMAAGLDAVLDWAGAARERLRAVDTSEEAIAELRSAVATTCNTMLVAAAQVSRWRVEAAVRLGAAVSSELSGLLMGESVMLVDVTPRPVGRAPGTVQVDGAQRGIGPDGFDDVAFLLQAHSDGRAVPLGRGASGGELSRIMLAVEVCLAGVTDVPIMIFDEVDAGVGGRAAVEVGRRLALLGRERQVLVVTHLAQVAAFADRHIVISRPLQAAVTASDVRVVDGPERVAELARMLAGSDTPAALRHAEQLLEHRSNIDTSADQRG